MGIQSPGVTLAIEAMFGNIKPVLDSLLKLGCADFSAEAPGVEIKPGATLKVPISSIAAASEYDASNNNYLTGGSTSWASLTAKHFLKGYDITGEDIDSGVNAPRIKQKFTSRAGSDIAAACQALLASSLSDVTTSTAVKIPAIGTATLASYQDLATAKTWLNGSTSILALAGTELANLKKLFAAEHIIGTNKELAEFLGFKDIALVPGFTGRAAIVPDGSIGYIARVPAIAANYRETGTETDPDTGLSIGIVIADDQGKNRIVANSDLWFGVAVLGCAAAASDAGIINVGTAT